MKEAFMYACSTGLWHRCEMIYVNEETRLIVTRE